MRKLNRMIGATFGALILAAAGVAAIAAPAQAEEPTEHCKTVAVDLTDRSDTGTGGHVWAKNKMTRTMKVCAEAASGDAVTATTRWKYSATVTDTGTFKTEAGKTPRGEAGLPAGVEGAVNGGFRANFTAESNFTDWTPGALKNDTSTGQWVKTVMPSAEGTLVGSYRWAYKTTCESYVDNDGEYVGDITGKTCTPEPKDCEAYVYTGTTENLCVAHPDRKSGYTCTDVKYRVTLKDVKVDPWGLDGSGGNVGVKGVGCESNPLKPAATPEPTTAPGTGGGGSLPVTGTAVGGIAAGAGLLLVVGGVMFFVARRRKVTFTA